MDHGRAAANVANQIGIYGTRRCSRPQMFRCAVEFRRLDDPSESLAVWRTRIRSTGNGSLSDLWLILVAMGLVKGPASVSQAGIYVRQPPALPSTHMWATPRTRIAPALDRPNNQFWMFGGEGFDLGGPTATAYSTTYGDTCPTKLPSQN